MYITVACGACAREYTSEHSERRILSRATLLGLAGKNSQRKCGVLFSTKNVHIGMHHEIDIRNIIIIVMAYYYNYYYIFVHYI